MPDIPPSPARGPLSFVTLEGADGLPFDPRLVLILRNPTESVISPRLVGSVEAPVDAPGVGLIDTTEGYPVGPIAAGTARAVPLGSIWAWLRGEVVITDGAGLAAGLIDLRGWRGRPPIRFRAATDGSVITLIEDRNPAPVVVVSSDRRSLVILDAP